MIAAPYRTCGCPCHERAEQRARWRQVVALIAGIVALVGVSSFLVWHSASGLASAPSKTRTREMAHRSADPVSDDPPALGRCDQLIRQPEGETQCTCTHKNGDVAWGSGFYFRCDQ